MLVTKEDFTKYLENIFKTNGEHLSPSTVIQYCNDLERMFKLSQEHNGCINPVSIYSLITPVDLAKL